MLGWRISAAKLVPVAPLGVLGLALGLARGAVAALLAAAACRPWGLPKDQGWLAWCAEFAEGRLALIHAAEPGRHHLSGALQVFGNADVDEVAGKKVCAEQLLADQSWEYVLL